jgi:hypothetical protein
MKKNFQKPPKRVEKKLKFILKKIKELFQELIFNFSYYSRLQNFRSISFQMYIVIILLSCGCFFFNYIVFLLNELNFLLFNLFTILKYK